MNRRQAILKACLLLRRQDKEESLAKFLLMYMLNETAEQFSNKLSEELSVEQENRYFDLINKNINDLEDFGETYIAENGQKVSIRKIYPLQKEFLRILGRNAKVYDSLEDGRFYIDIYIKDLKTNETFIIKRDNISIYYESAGIKLYLPSI